MALWATTTSAAEFVHLIDWCHDTSGLGHFVCGWEAGGVYHVALTDPVDDVRLGAFQSWFVDRTGWSVTINAAGRAERLARRPE